MSFRSIHKVGYEPIPGYTLRKRLGAGGYGEVWLADAPGGLQKAVKLIYGTVDQSHATSELRSLQRIRQVYHPFLLSLERIEIVDNQVVIITELAESSLLDRFEQCRRQGAPGIDRAPLLDFLRDAADALDFLSQKHALQHLDVKPGNLLVIADRIKVADFGLIKDLHDQNQSLVSGLTPTYSAPEIFDGRPDYRSDQYSLAIVYMEMLTGQLPFSGKTTGELARQHLTQQPDLESLPPADRTIVGRALSKNPLDRYSTCRQFIEQLLKTRGAALPLGPHKTNSNSSEGTEEAPTCVNENKTSTACPLSGPQELQAAIGVQGIAKQWLNARAVFIGLGGLGCRALLHLRSQAMRDCDNRLDIEEHGWLGIDTHAPSLNAIIDEEQEVSLPPRCVMELPLFRPSEYRDAEPELFGPLSRRWLYNIPRSLTTEGVRPLSILTLLDHYPNLKNRLASELRAVIHRQTEDTDCQEPLRIYVLASLHGGTGSALLAEMGLLVRRILNEQAYHQYRICAIASAATTTHNHAANLYSAAALATLSELDYMMTDKHEVPGIYYGDRNQVVKSAKPFDWVTLVDGGLHGSADDAEKATQDLARIAWIDSQSLMGAALTPSRTEAASVPRAWLRTTSVAPISASARVTANGLAHWCCEQTLMQAARYLAGTAAEARETGGAHQPPTSGSPTNSGDFPLTPLACEDFSRRLWCELGIAEIEDARHKAQQLEQGQCPRELWARRLSSEPDVVAQQLQADGETWRRNITRLVKLQVYNWKQIEQIQLYALERLVKLYEHESPELPRLLAALEPGLRTPEEIQSATVAYLRVYSERCLKLLQDFQSEGRRLAQRVRLWSDSIAAEKSLNDVPWDISLAGLSPSLQLLTNRVHAVLASTLHHLTTQIAAGVSPTQSTLPPAAAEPPGGNELNLQYLLSLSVDLVSRLSTEMGISPEELAGRRTAAGISLKQIASFQPALTSARGKLFRLVLSPVEQEPMIQAALKQKRLDGTTTLLPGRRSLDTYAVCDALDFPLPQLISELWRPSLVTLQLAERLRTRTDIDWIPASKLLEHAEPPACELPILSSSPPAAAGHSIALPQAGTMPLPLDA
ncbi:MAG: protein kinase [Planctomycetales bacterium]|nr:protein kinase [Planctomycetales bacterium]